MLHVSTVGEEGIVQGEVDQEDLLLEAGVGHLLEIKSSSMLCIVHRQFPRVRSPS